MASVGSVSTRAEIHTSISAAATPDLATLLLREFDEVQDRFHRGDFRPSELSGGRFGEVVFRICQQVCLGTHTPAGRSLPNTNDLIEKFEKTPGTKADDTFRIHIPRSLRLIYDLRSKRDVAHLGSSVSPNLSDASLVVTIASWIVAEIVRVSHKCSMDTAQAIVDSLVQRRVPLLWVEKDFIRVLNPAVKPSERALLVLYHFQPEWVTDSDLMRYIEEPRVGNFNRLIETLHKRALVQHSGDRTKILPPGMKFVETSPKLRHV
jgi:hypothetical protein